MLDKPMIIKAKVSIDDRGALKKFFSSTELNISFQKEEWREFFISISKKNVLRGMHFQKPPHHHSKLVSCIKGAITDIVVDLRRQRPTYGEIHEFQLNSESHESICVPAGFAHGFLSLEENTIVSYLTSSVHNQDSDTGIRFNSFGYDWQLVDPIVSPRDLLPPSFDDLENFF